MLNRYKRIINFKHNFKTFVVIAFKINVTYYFSRVCVIITFTLLYN